MKVVIHHPYMGVFLGSFIGLAFWSKVTGTDGEPSMFPGAPLFDSEADARAFVLTWQLEPAILTEMAYQPVAEEDVSTLVGQAYVTAATCGKLGLHDWQPHGLSVAKFVEIDFSKADTEEVSRMMDLINAETSATLH